MRRQCRRIAGPVHAEDAQQRALLKALLGLRAAGGRSIDLGPWLHRVTRNAALDVVQAAGPATATLPEGLDGVPQPPEVAAQRAEVAAAVAAITALPERQRRALVAHALEGRSWTEIAAELGTDEGAVAQLLVRARRRLRAGVAAVTAPVFLLRSRAAHAAPAATPASGGLSVAGVSLAGKGAVVLAVGVLAGGGTALVGHAGHRAGSRPVATLAAAPVAGTTTVVAVPAGRASIAAGRPRRGPGQRRGGGATAAVITPTRTAGRAPESSPSAGAGASASAAAPATTTTAPPPTTAAPGAAAAPVQQAATDGHDGLAADRDPAPTTPASSPVTVASSPTAPAAVPPTGPSATAPTTTATTTATTAEPAPDPAPPAAPVAPPATHRIATYTQSPSYGGPLALAPVGGGPAVQAYLGELAVLTCVQVHEGHVVATAACGPSELVAGRAVSRAEHAPGGQGVERWTAVTVLVPV